HQRAGADAAEALERVEVEPQRVAPRLIRPDADVGGDARQYLIARDQHVEVVTPERAVLRRVAAADDDCPAPASEHERLHDPDRPDRTRQREHQLRLVIPLPGEGAERRLAPAVAAIVARPRLVVARLTGPPGELTDEVLGLATPEIDAPAFGEPGG